MDDAAVAAFQAVLLAVLATETDGERIRERMLAEPAAAPFRAWVLAWEPRMVAVGGSLVRQWGRRG